VIEPLFSIHHRKLVVYLNTFECVQITNNHMVKYRSSLPILLVLACLACVFTVGCKSSSTPTGPGGGEQSYGTLSGVVTDSVTQKPIGQAVVQIAGLTTQKITDSLGNYKFDSVQVGPYLVTISKTGYVSHSDSVAIVKNVITTLSRALASSTGGTGGNAFWTQVTSNAGSQNLNGICYAGGGYFYAAGDNSIVSVSSDHGITWTNAAQTFEQLLDIAFSDKLNGIGVGPNGVTVTTDGGNSWSTSQPNHNHYRSIARIGNVSYIAGCDKLGGGVVSASMNGGQDWIDVFNAKFDPTDSQFAIAMVSPTYICAVGLYGEVRISDSSYNVWKDVPVKATSASLLSVAMPSFHDIFVVGELGAIFHSQDSGNSWIKQNSGVTTTLRHVAFFDSKIGLAVGDAGLILQTKDGGITWQNTSIPGNNFFGCAFEDATHAIIVGSGGVIYKSKIK
jgi:photosystem II stability/assembly factor-like uncharacterized protein